MVAVADVTQQHCRLPLKSDWEFAPCMSALWDCHYHGSPIAMHRALLWAMGQSHSVGAHGRWAQASSVAEWHQYASENCIPERGVWKESLLMWQFRMFFVTRITDFLVPRWFPSINLITVSGAIWWWELSVKYQLVTLRWYFFWSPSHSNEDHFFSEFQIWILPVGATFQPYDGIGLGCGSVKQTSPLLSVLVLIVLLEFGVIWCWIYPF